MGYRITLGDLSKTFTVEQVQTLIDEIVEEIAEVTIPALLDHWTDSEGLHRQPFDRELRGELRDTSESLLNVAVQLLD